jgi:hypothetical protein
VLWLEVNVILLSLIAISTALAVLTGFLNVKPKT